MTGLFIKILSMSYDASWMILGILAIRLLFRRIPRWGNVLLWMIAVTRLLMPVTIPCGISLIPLKQEILDAPIMEYVQLHMFERNPVTPANGVEWIWVFSVLWLVGVAALMGYFAVRYWKLADGLKTAVRLQGPVFQSESVNVPMVVGFFKPKIYLPFRMKESVAAYVIAHEQTHIRRGDHWWKPLGFLALTVHWFNPLVWLCYVMLGRDIELACDEAVIRDLDHHGRADYSQVLVEYSAKSGFALGNPLGFGQIGVKERIKSVLNYRQPKVYHHIALTVICLALGLFFLTSPAAEGKPILTDPVTQQQPPREDPTGPTKDLTGIDLNAAPVKSQIAAMQKELESLKLDLAKAQYQYETAASKDRPPLKDLMDHYEDRIEELSRQIRRAKNQIGAK